MTNAQRDIRRYNRKIRIYDIKKATRSIDAAGIGCNLLIGVAALVSLSKGLRK